MRLPPPGSEHTAHAAAYDSDRACRYRERYEVPIIPKLVKVVAVFRFEFVTVGFRLEKENGTENVPSEREERQEDEEKVVQFGYHSRKRFVSDTRILGFLTVSPIVIRDSSHHTVHTRTERDPSSQLKVHVKIDTVKIVAAIGLLVLITV